MVDKEKLAIQLIEMCKENSFKSIKFATDIRGYPVGIYMRVYLNRWDFNRGKIFMQVKYLPAEKTNCSLLFAHTHPASELFPKECQVYTDVGFSNQDLRFNESMNKLLEKKNMLSNSVYYLVINNCSYCAVMYYKKKYSDVTIPVFQHFNIRKSSWEIKEHVFTEK